MKRWLLALATFIGPTTKANAISRGALLLLLLAGASTAIVIGTTTISGTCTNGAFLYNNSNVVGCSAGTPGTIAIPNAVTGGVSGAVPFFSNTTTMGTSALLTANALMVGGGAGVAPSTVTTGTGALTALGVNVGSAGAFVVNGGALGTPSGGTLTNTTGLPISTGVSGLGTGVATALAAATNGAGGIDTVDGTATLSNKTINTPTFAVTGTPAWSVDANSSLYPRATLSTSMTTGFLNIPGAAGVPSGVPANTTGIPLYWNTSANTLYGYNAGWQAISGGGGGTPGGANTQVQFNNSSAFGGSANFTWDNTNNVLSLSSSLTGSQATNTLLLSPTWNTTGTPSAFKINVTDTASNASSWFLDFQVASSAQFRVKKNGSLNWPTGNPVTLDNSSYFVINSQSVNGAITIGGFNMTPGAAYAIGSPTTGFNSFSLAQSGAFTGITLITSGGTATLQLGAADAAAPVAQTFQVQNVVAGTTNTAGTNFTINGSRGTGTGVGGSIIFQVAPAGTTGSAQNALAAALTIAPSGAATFAATVKTAGYTVAGLPAGTVGMRAYVTDQTTACVAAGAALTGGGAITCPVFYNGSAWVGD
jgi:hypothetical protein